MENSYIFLTLGISGIPDNFEKDPGFPGYQFRTGILSPSQTLKIRRLNVRFGEANMFHSLKLHTEKSFRNLIKSNRNQIVFAIFRLIWNTDGRPLVSQIYQKMVNTI